MRRLVVKLFVFLALAWGAWWWIASSGLQRGATAWLDAQQDNGVTATVENWSRGGFPLRIAAHAQNAVWSDSAKGTELRIPTFTLSSPIHWPGDARAELPEGPVTFKTPQGTATFTTQGAQAEVHLHPGSTLQLEAMRAEASYVSLDLVEGRVFDMQSLEADVQQGNDPATYTIDLTAIGFAFGSILQENAQLPPTWPKRFEPIIADMTVTFDRPWDRSALQRQRPQPRTILIEKIEALYADLGLVLAGNLTVDEQGIPSGLMNVKIQNWQQLFDIIVAVTEIPSEWQGTVEQVLGAMSDMDGTIDLDITFAQGQMRLGFFPLGPAPRIVIR